MTTLSRTPFALALGLLLSGCINPLQRPETGAPQVVLPERWRQAAATTPTAAQPVQADSWLNGFQTPALASLIQEALANNPSLQLVRARLEAGDAQATLAGADQRPELDLSLSAARSGSEQRAASDFSAGLDIAWEADLWGKLQAASRAAVSDLQALEADLQAARLSLAANVSKAWFGLTEALLQRRLSEQRVANLRANLEILQEGYGQGLFAALDIHLARSSLAAEEARLHQRLQSEGESRRQLELLLGRYPGSQLPAGEALPALPEAVPAGLPSSLLQRRPDLRAAALRITSAELRADQAYKARFPSLLLTSDLGYSSDALSGLLSGGNLFWSVFGGLSQPLFDGDRLQTREALAVAELRQERARYLDTLLTAFAEVESALQQERELHRQVAALQRSWEEAAHAEHLAFEQYQSGLVDYITVLEAQRRAFDSHSTLIQARNQLLQNRLDLYLALGGDFIPAEPGSTFVPKA